MDFKKLAPWNWFKKEDNDVFAVPVRQSVQENDVKSINSLLQLQRDIEGLFENMQSFFDPILPIRQSEVMDTLTQGLIKPRLDLSTDGSEYLITVELPGVEQQEIKLEEADGVLTISGEKKQERKESKQNYYRVERSYGSFQRVLALPDDADQNSVQAIFKNGVLTIKIKKHATSNSGMKKIEIH